VVTVDTPMLGWRERDLANMYSPFSHGHGIGQFTSDPIFRSMLDFDPDREPGRAGQEMMKLFVNPGLGWDDLAWLRGLTDLPILLKGVLRADDARQALDAGIDGLIVSNHGGRQVDGSVSALDALGAVRTAASADIPVLLDGGVRRGSDVIKAVALGADAVLVGRPYVYGLAAGGRAGVHEVLSNLLAETDSVLALSGYRRLGELDCGALADEGPWRRLSRASPRNTGEPG
jgi:L-lactate dehydrogenase (cytochrome)